MRRIFGISPESPIFRPNDPYATLNSLAVRFDYALGNWSGEAVFRFLVDTLASGGQDHDAARAAALQWMGRALTLDDRLAEAKVALSASLDLSGSTFGRTSPRRAECFYQLALVEEALCESTASREHYVRAIQLALHGCERNQSDVVHYLENFVTFLRVFGSKSEADFVADIEGQLRGQFFPLH